MDTDQYRREKQSFILRVIVGDVSNSGYMSRLTQEHACLRISTKPVDMPEDSPQKPQHPPNVTHRPERTWGILVKTKGQTKEYRGETKIPEILAINDTRSDTLKQFYLQRSARAARKRVYLVRLQHCQRFTVQRLDSGFGLRLLALLLPLPTQSRSTEVSVTSRSGVLKG